MRTDSAKTGKAQIAKNAGKKANLKNFVIGISHSAARPMDPIYQIWREGPDTICDAGSTLRHGNIPIIPMVTGLA
ncbi:MAG: hypothetical protein ACPGNV_00795 [Mangrovicoccus sp.]